VPSETENISPNRYKAEKKLHRCIKFSGLLCCVRGLLIPDISTDAGGAFLQNAANQ
jgi:hypothetical protein